MSVSSCRCGRKRSTSISRPTVRRRSARSSPASSFRRLAGGFVGVSNVGDSSTWLGADLAMANLYGFGRLAWNPSLTAERIADEWTRQTFGNDPSVVETTNGILLGSWPGYEHYTGPLGPQLVTGGVGGQLLQPVRHGPAGSGRRRAAGAVRRRRRTPGAAGRPSGGAGRRWRPPGTRRPGCGADRHRHLARLGQDRLHLLHGVDGEPVQLAPRGGDQRGEGRLVARRTAGGGDQLVGRGVDAVGDQVGDLAVGVELEGQPGARRQRPDDLPGRGAGDQHEQAPGPTPGQPLASAAVGTTRMPTVSPSSTSAGYAVTTCAPRWTSTVRGSVPNSHASARCARCPTAARARLARAFGATCALSAARSLPVASGRCWSSSTRKVARRWSGTWSGAQASGGIVTAVGPAQLALQRRQQRLARVDVRQHLAHPVGDRHQRRGAAAWAGCAAAPSPVPPAGPGR